MAGRRVQSRNDLDVWWKIPRKQAVGPFLYHWDCIQLRGFHANFGCRYQTFFEYINGLSKRQHKCDKVLQGKSHWGKADMHPINL